MSRARFVLRFWMVCNAFHVWLPLWPFLQALRMGAPLQVVELCLFEEVRTMLKQREYLRR